MDLKAPLSFDEQIQKLKDHGIVISDITFARSVLQKVNYYRFSGYALQFRKKPSKSECVKGTTFDAIYHLYIVDEELRDVFRKYIEKAEVYYRTQISYGFALNKCGTSPHDQHYDDTNFFNKKGYKEVMDNFSREKNYYKDSLIVKHHAANYDDKMPLWVMVELMSFSNLSKFYSAMYYSEKDFIAGNVGISRDTLQNHLHCLSILRNKCAHAARLYNTKFNPPVRFTKSFLRKNPNVKNDSLFAYVLVLLRRLPDQESKRSFAESVEKAIVKYEKEIDMELLGFPINYADILKNNI